MSESDLEKRLRSILEDTIPGDHSIYFEAYDQAIAEILTAIKDAGYIKP